MPPIRPGKPGSPPATVPATGAEAASGAATATTGQVHALPGTPGGEFNAARVAAIREDIRAGRYQVNPERIADGLIDSVRNLLGTEKKA